MGLACGQNLAALATGSALDGLMQDTAVEALVSPRDEGQRGVAILRQAPKTSPPSA
jgi:hypothetical protein